MGMAKDVFDEYGNYKYPDYSNSQYTHDVSTTGGALMGMSIDEAIKQLETYTIPCGKYKAAYDLAIDTMRKYKLFQVEYTKRLRADMVAMLEELKEQLREMHEDFFETEHFDEAYGVSVSMDEIQQKINSLKENT